MVEQVHVVIRDVPPQELPRVRALAGGVEVPISATVVDKSCVNARIQVFADVDLRLSVAANGCVSVRRLLAAGSDRRNIEVRLESAKDLLLLTNRALLPGESLYIQSPYGDQIQSEQILATVAIVKGVAPVEYVCVLGKDGARRDVARIPSSSSNMEKILVNLPSLKGLRVRTGAAGHLLVDGPEGFSFHSTVSAEFLTSMAVYDDGPYYVALVRNGKLLDSVVVQTWTEDREVVLCGE